ncbi:MAG TPA: hypothetical protein ENI51_04295, partial [Candidatus Atribacteria bacterium]|nr:hypothetical protein [Candidatus Atribacteria bacterium]
MEKIKPNIILITIDCLRADHMSCYGYKRKTTPFIDKLAEEGMQFMNAFTNGSFTALSVLSFLTSRLPFLWSGGVSIVELLKKNGYYTMAFVPNALVLIQKEINIRKGFVFFQTFLDYKKIKIKDKISKYVKKFRFTHKLLTKFYVHFSPNISIPYARAHEINKKVFEYLKEIRQPFFLWIHYMDAHQPTLPPN